MSLAPHALVSPASPTAELRTAYFLHGILGSGGNLRTLAKRVLELTPGWEAVLVDLPGHGRSEAMPMPHTVAACALAVQDLAQSLKKTATAIVGHSFGGKVALVATETMPSVRACCTLDSAPGERLDHHGSESTLKVLDALRALPKTFATRAEFAGALGAAGLSADLIAWLALNLVATTNAGSEVNAFRFRLDLDVIDALLGDYFALDCWPILAQPSPIAFSVVVGGASTVWDAADLTRAKQISGLAVTVVPGASHWLHVDALEATAKAISESLRSAA